jgi:flagellar motor switch/type III secretory pathway protein FliN
MTRETTAFQPPKLRRAFVAARRAVREALEPAPGGSGLLGEIAARLDLPLRLLGIAPAEARDGATGRAAAAWCIHLRTGNGETVVRIDDALATTAASGILGTEAWALPADGGGEPMAGVLAVQTLRALAAAAGAGRPAELVDVHRAVLDAPDAGERTRVSLRVLAGDRVGRVELAVASPEEPSLPHAGPLPAWVAVLPVELGLTLARGRVPQADLRALRAGDAVAFDETAGELADAVAGTVGWLQAVAAGDPGPRWLCRRAGDGPWMIQAGSRETGAARRVAMGATDGSDRTDVCSMGEGGAAIDAVPLEVTAVAGRATLSVRELAALGPGSVVPLGRATAGVVDLLANGIAFARGRLVDLDGELAVEVTELRAGSGPT